MDLLLWSAFVPALLLCGLKLSLAEKLWEIVPSALLIAAAPVVLHRFTARASLLQVERTLRAPETLAAFSAMLALEAILSLVLVAAVLTAHADFSMLSRTGKADRRPAFYGAAFSGVLALLLTGRLAASNVLQAAALILLTGLLFYPWLPRGNTVRPAAIRGGNTGLRAVALLITPVWALLSPAGLAAIVAMHLHILHTVSGMDLWRLTLLYAAALFAALTTMAVLLRFAVRPWRLRLGGVMLLAFLLLMAAMFVPQLISKTPPPASAIQVNWPATAAVTLLSVLVAAAGMRWNTWQPPETG
jgi:hypothetical protein